MKDDALDELVDIIERARSLPPMTEEESKMQRLDFAYGNLALTRNHKPRYAAFKALAREMGIAEDTFDQWAVEKDWTW